MGIIIWFTPAPAGLTTEAWPLFVIFITTIIAVILNAASIFSLAIAALAITVVNTMIYLVVGSTWISIPGIQLPARCLSSESPDTQKSGGSHPFIAILISIAMAMEMFFPEAN